MKLPCEQALWYVLPQIRAELAMELVKQGLSQREAADALGITPAAVSQYLHKKRGEKTKVTVQDRKMIKEAAREIKTAPKEEAVSRLICRCCHRMNK